LARDLASDKLRQPKYGSPVRQPSTAAQYGSPVRRPGGVDCLGNTGPRNRLRPALPSDGVL